MTRKKMCILYIEQKRGTEHTDYDDDDRPIDYMTWKKTIFTIKVGRTKLRDTIQRYSDGDYDFSSRVLFVTKEDGTILLDFVNHEYVHAHDYMEGEKAEHYTERLKSIRKREDFNEEEMLKRIEKYPELIWGE